PALRAVFSAGGWLPGPPPLPVVPSQPQGRPERRGRRQLIRWLRCRRRLFGRGVVELRWQRWLLLPRSCPARDFHRDLLVVRQGGLSTVPPDKRQARLLQRLVPDPAR